MNRIALLPALPNVQRYLETCTFTPATLAGEPVPHELRLWVRVSDRG